MQAYKHILYATDLGEVSQAVGKKAQQLAKAFGAKITLVHAIEPIPAYGYPGYADLESPFIERAKEEMSKLGNSLNISADDQHIKLGSVKIQVTEMAKKIGADLIVIGTHSRHGLARLLGSNASAIVHAAPCDVLTLHCGD